MMKLFTSFGAGSNFERYRLELTEKTLDAPNEQSMKNLMKTFCGEDNQTRSQIAFATIVKKILTSDSKDNWIYLIKNLIILDKIIEENIFTEDIASLTLPTIENFKEKDSKFIQFDVERIIKIFWKLLKQKSIALASKKHIFAFKRSQRVQFLASLTPSQILKQIQSIQYFFSLTYDLIELISWQKTLEQMRIKDLAERKARARSQLTRSKLVEYLYLQILHKLMQYYSCQLLCCNYFIKILMDVNNKSVKDEDLRRYKKHVLKFKVNSNDYIKYVEDRKHLKGFDDVNYKELNPFQNQDIIKLIDQYINQRNQNLENKMHNVETLVVEKNVGMVVEKKPLNNLSKEFLTPRLKNFRGSASQMMGNSNSSSSSISTLSEQDVNPFTNYINSYSKQFPQKEIMTVDLIIQIKRRQKEPVDEDDPVIYNENRESCIYDDNRGSNISLHYEITYAPEVEVELVGNKRKESMLSDHQNNNKADGFENIYSQLETVWNQS